MTPSTNPVNEVSLPFDADQAEGKQNLECSENINSKFENQQNLTSELTSQTNALETPLVYASPYTPVKPVRQSQQPHVEELLHPDSRKTSVSSAKNVNSGAKLLAPVKSLTAKRTTVMEFRTQKKIQKEKPADASKIATKDKQRTLATHTEAAIQSFLPIRM